jgi:uncharacterized protein YcfL
MLNRSALLTVAVAVLLVTAGCQTTQNASTPTTTTEAGTTTLETPTPTTEETTTTTTQESAFNASVSFPDCHTVEIDADAYRWVGIVHTEGVLERPGNYSGSTTFEVNGSVESVLVYGQSDGRVNVENPDYAECTKPEPTTTQPTTTVETTTTATPTPTPTPTPTTTVPTTTTTTTTTATPTTTEEREPLRKYKITRHTINESLEAGYTEIRVKNWHEDEVSLNYDVVWYSDRDIMENVDRHELVLESGESVVLESSYGGNGSAYAVEYSVSELEYTEDDDG